MITDAPLWKIQNPTNNPNLVSPGTPCSPSAIANSPWSPALPNSAGEKRSVSNYYKLTQLIGQKVL